MTLNFYFKTKYWSRQYFEGPYIIISQTITDMIQVTNDNEWEVIHNAFGWYIYISPWFILEVKVKVVHILTMNIFEKVIDEGKN